MPPRILYCIKYQLAGVYLSAKPHRLICIHSHHKLHPGDTNYIKHAQLQYVYAIKHSPSGLVLYSVYVPIGHALSNIYMLVREWWLGNHRNSNKLVVAWATQDMLAQL